jgi:2-octaprenyl-6-methoxyphenol hydroxylase
MPPIADTRPPAAETDVVIVGGGLAGASLGCALAGTGLRTAVIEAVPREAEGQPSYDDRSVALAYGSKRIFAGMNVWPGVASRGAAPIERIHVSDRGRFGFTRLDRRHAGLEALGYVVETRVLGAALYQRLGAVEGLELICPAAVTGIARDAEGITVSIDGPQAVGERRGRLLVLADGGRSAARELLGIEVRNRDYGQTALVANVTPGHEHRNTAYERFTATGPLAVLPMTQGRCSVVWTVRPPEAEHLLALTDAEFLGALQDRFGERLGVFRQVGRRNAYPLSMARVHPTVVERAALIGNAAHALHPVAGQGFNLGLRDVATLAQILAEAARDGDDIGSERVLGRYARWRRRDNQAMTAFTDGLVRLFSNDLAPIAAVRDLGLLAVDLFPPAKRALLRLTTGMWGRQPRLGRGLEL